MKPWDNASSYTETVRLLSTTKCDAIGIDITHFQLEYPLQALLREDHPNLLFIHTGVNNASARYPQPAAAPAWRGGQPRSRETFWRTSKSTPVTNKCAPGAPNRAMLRRQASAIAGGI